MHPQPSPTDDGFTLVEVLMALIVLGIGVAALMAAMGMHVKTSAANRNQAAGAAMLVTASEYVKSYAWNPTVSGGTCAAIQASDLPTPAPTPPTGYTVTYGAGQTMPPASPCELQKMTVEVKGFGYDLQVDVAKRASTEVAP